MDNEPSQRPTSGSVGRDLVTLARFTEAWHADVLRMRLEAEGILASVADWHTVIGYWPWSNAIGGARVKVPLCELADAQEVIAALNRGDYALEDDDEFACPRCGGRGNTILTAQRRFAFLAFFVFKIPIPLGRHGLKCDACAHEWLERPEDAPGNA